MIPIRNQSRAIDVTTHPNAEHRDHFFIADEPDNARERHPPERRDRLRMDEPLDGLVAGEKGAE